MLFKLYVVIKKQYMSCSTGVVSMAVRGAGVPVLTSTKGFRLCKLPQLLYASHQELETSWAPYR